MNDIRLDRIMKRYMGKDNDTVNIEKAVMSRIREYEEKRSVVLFYWEYALSALAFCSGIMSIYVIQYVFYLYGSFFELYQINSLFAYWLSTAMFVLLILSAVWIIYFTTMLKRERKFNLLKF